MQGDDGAYTGAREAEAARLPTLWNWAQIGFQIVLFQCTSLEAPFVDLSHMQRFEGLSPLVYKLPTHSRQHIIWWSHTLNEHLCKLELIWHCKLRESDWGTSLLCALSVRAGVCVPLVASGAWGCEPPSTSRYRPRIDSVRELARVTTHTVIKLCFQVYEAYVVKESYMLFFGLRSFGNHM